MRIGALMLLLGLLVVSAPRALAQEDTLRLGDAAPGLSIEAWLNGDEIYIENGNTYLVYFCNDNVLQRPSQRQAMTLGVMMDLHTRYEHRGLNMIWVTEDEEFKYYQRTVIQGGRKDLEHSIGYDRRGATKSEWVDKAKKEIPVAFLVDENGKIQYMGDLLERNIENITRMLLDGRYDYRKMQNAAPRREAAEKYRELRNFRMYHQVMTEMIEIDTRVFAYDNLDRFKTMLVDQDEPTNAYNFARGLMKAYEQDGSMLIALAETVATDPYIPTEKRDLDFALEVAKKADGVSELSEPDKYAIEALVRFHRGELREAVSLQKKAFFTAVPIDKERYRKVLRDYQEAAQVERRRDSTESADR